MSNTVVLFLLRRNRYSWGSFVVLAINATSKSVSVSTTTVGLSDTVSADDMIMESASDLACWTSIPAFIRWWVSSFMRRPLFFTLLRKSACEVVVGILPSNKMLAETFFDALLACSTDFVELLVITIKYNFGITFVVANYIMHIALAYFIISSRFGPDNCLEQVATIHYVLWVIR